MALTTTTLSAAISNSRTQNIALANTTGFAVGQAVKIDNEYMWTTGVTTTAITVRSRGADGSTAVGHDVLALVSTSASPSDFPVIPPGWTTPTLPAMDDVITIGQDVTITPPNKNTTYNIAKASVCNITLNSGTAANAGVQLTFLSNSAFGHIITYAAGFRGGVNTVATFANTVGSALVAEVGQNGILAVLANPGVTLSA